MGDGTECRRWDFRKDEVSASFQPEASLFKVSADSQLMLSAELIQSGEAKNVPVRAKQNSCLKHCIPCFDFITESKYHILYRTFSNPVHQLDLLRMGIQAEIVFVNTLIPESAVVPDIFPTELLNRVGDRQDGFNADTAVMPARQRCPITADDGVSKL
ncbi:MULTISPECIES: hypothetical protein [Pseudomonas fluorescens group]|uniref:hypothetical protein n=1 Tax=Pseudomonas fluorescens group TaxID=136843 RepID=UPI0012EC2EB7|nr:MULTISPECIES: hypothetical protein [Pseudomonas fluorescens group]